MLTNQYFYIITKTKRYTTFKTEEFKTKRGYQTIPLFNSNNLVQNMRIVFYIVNKYYSTPSALNTASSAL